MLAAFMSARSPNSQQLRDTPLLAAQGGRANVSHLRPGQRPNHPWISQVPRTSQQPRDEFRVTAQGGRADVHRTRPGQPPNKPHDGGCLEAGCEDLTPGSHWRLAATTGAVSTAKQVYHHCRPVLVLFLLVALVVVKKSLCVTV